MVNGQRQNGPIPMQLVVPSAVSAAVSAAIAMRITISQTEFFFIRFTFLPFYFFTFNWSLRSSQRHTPTFRWENVLQNLFKNPSSFILIDFIIDF